MNLQQIAAKHKIAEHFLNAREDGLTVAVKSVDELIYEIKKGNFEQEELIYKLSKLRNFMFDVRNSTH